MQNKPYGKGLSGFIFGLLLATLIIGVVLYFLNNTPSGIKQPEAPKTEIQPEILTPRQGHQPEQRPNDTTTAGSDSGHYTLPPGDITDKPPVAACTAPGRQARAGRQTRTNQTARAAAQTRTGSQAHARADFGKRQRRACPRASPPPAA